MEKICAHCRKSFTGQRSTRLYCSDNCKQLAYYRRNGLILSVGKNGYDDLLASHATVKDVNNTNHNETTPDSFLAKLNALVHEEVERRITLRGLQANPTEKIPATVKPSFTLNSYAGDDFVPAEFARDMLQQESLTVKKSATVKQSFTLNDKPDFLARINASKRNKRNTADDLTVSKHKIQSIPLSRESENSMAHKIGELKLEAQILSDELLSDTDHQRQQSLHENDPLTSVSDDDSERNESNRSVDTRPFSWVYSSFTERVNNHLIFSDDDISGYISKFGNNGVKVMETCKCLIKHVMLLSDRNEINHSSLITLSNAFYSLAQTKEFLSLPMDFPYHSKISELQKKIRSFAQTITAGESVRLHLPAEQRATFFAMLSEMGNRIKDVKIGEIDFSNG